MRHAEEIFLLCFIAWRNYVGIILRGAREFFVHVFTPRYMQLHARIESKKRECWKALGWRFNSKSD